MRAMVLVLAFLGLSGPLIAQEFTLAAEVRPILAMTRANWVSLREYDGADLVYFTHLLAWRCGLTEIRYGLNGAAPSTVFAMEPCHDGTAQPNAITADTIFVRQPLGSVQAVSVQLTYDDGAVEQADFLRAQVLMR